MGRSGMKLVELAKAVGVVVALYVAFPGGTSDVTGSETYIIGSCTTVGTVNGACANGCAGTKDTCTGCPSPVPSGGATKTGLCQAGGLAGCTAMPGGNPAACTQQRNHRMIVNTPGGNPVCVPEGC